VAKNDAALSGGTSEEVQVVDKTDQSSLVKDLTAELLEKLKSSALVGSSTGTGAYLIEDSATAKDVTYSAKVGEAAKSLTVNLTVKATLLKYQTEAVTTLVNSAIDQAVPTGYVRANLPSTVDLTASEVAEGGSSVEGSAKVKVALLPLINVDELRSLLKGKNITGLENILKQYIPGYQSAQVVITPGWIPIRLKSIPRNPSNITLDLAPI
jgi:hypothetical protein